MLCDGRQAWAVADPDKLWEGGAADSPGLEQRPRPTLRRRERGAAGGAGEAAGSGEPPIHRG
eukprot:1190472-Pyramimonas_sp.AAC.1